MKHHLLHNRLRLAFAQFLCLILGLAFSATPMHAAQTDAADPNALCVMTYNLRFASDRPPNAWPDRRPIMRDSIRDVAPDLIGTQEGVYHQLKDMAQDLPEYDWIGLGRDGGSRGEFMAIYYLRDRFEPLEYDHFWLSDTPEIIASTTWGHSNRRMVTWVKFHDRQADREFYFWNTHFDHQVQPAREKSAHLILERINALNTSLPVILLGDFNATAGRNPVYDILVNDDAFVDTWNTAKERRGEVVKTFHGFRGPTPGDDRIDWILTRGPVACDATEIPTFHRDGQYPSDHFPVVAWLRWLP
jgi:endonuclease/exonuclease/phosphatase family metal-dependent hydrolase